MLCYNCMREKGNETICPFCGAENLTDPSTHHLAPGTVIGGRYTLGRVLGEGGFGITYIGFDTVLDIIVAVKEYFPYGVSHRVNTVSNTVTISAGDREEFFEKGKRRFLSEAKNVARFRKEPGIVTVTDFIEENNTAYIVMEYLDGVDLRHYLRQNGALSVDRALDLLLPVIKSLDKMHAAGVIHRDISPDNLMVLGDGSVKLMDFGAAREYVSDERSMSVMLKKGYAPAEQYRSNGKQGPWTDVYGICATLYRCITGKTPVESLDRVFDDPLQRPSEFGVSIAPAVEDVLMYGLAVRREDRCQNMAELYRLFTEARQQSAGSNYIAQPIPVPPVEPYQNNVTQPVPEPDRNEKTQAAEAYVPQPPYTSTQGPTGAPTGNYSYVVPPEQKKKGVPKKAIIIGAVAAVLVIALVILIIVNPFGKKSTTPVVSSGSTEAVSSTDTSASSSGSSSSSSSQSNVNINNGFTVAETDNNAKRFEKVVNYLYGIIDLDKYEVSLSSSSSYQLSADKNYCIDTSDNTYKTKLVYKGGMKYHCGTDIKIEGKTYNIGKTTLKEMMADGWTYDKNQEEPKKNKSSELVNLTLKGKTITTFLNNTGSDPTAAVIDTYFIDGPAGYDDTPASFDFQGFTNSVTSSTAYKIGAPSEIEVYVGSYSATITYNYDTTDSDLSFDLEFDYDGALGSDSLDSLHLFDFI